MWSEGAKAPRELEWVIRDGSGRGVDRQERSGPSSGGDFGFANYFAPGKYTIEASTDNGLRAEGSFTVEDLTDRNEAEALEFPLR